MLLLGNLAYQGLPCPYCIVLSCSAAKLKARHAGLTGDTTLCINLSPVCLLSRVASLLSGVAGGDGSIVHVEVTPRQAVAGKGVGNTDTGIAAAA